MQSPDDDSRRPRLTAAARSKFLEDFAEEEENASTRIPGTPETVLQAMRNIQMVPASLVDEMEEAIREGHIGADDTSIFDEQAG